jgi:hypothetical protein
MDYSKLGQTVDNQKLTEVDKDNSEDVLVICIEMLNQVKKYDFTVLQPINYQMITMCEYGLLYYP